MVRARIPAFASLLVCATLMLLAACDRPLSDATPPQRGDSPLEELWFRDLTHFLGRIHRNLDDPAQRVELRFHLLAGREEWALKRMHIQPEEVSALFARMEMLRADLERRWPELLDTGGEQESFAYPASLLDLLESDAWPTAPPPSAKPPREMCAAIQLYEDLSGCTSWNPYAQVFCMYYSYLRYLQHLSQGCGG